MAPTQTNRPGQFHLRSQLGSDDWSLFTSVATARNSAGLKFWDRVTKDTGSRKRCSGGLLKWTSSTRKPKRGKIKASSRERMLSCPLGKGTKSKAESHREVYFMFSHGDRESSKLIRASLQMLLLSCWLGSPMRSRSLCSQFQDVYDFPTWPSFLNGTPVSRDGA